MCPTYVFTQSPHVPSVIPVFSSTPSPFHPSLCLLTQALQHCVSLPPTFYFFFQHEATRPESAVCSLWVQVCCTPAVGSLTGKGSYCSIRSPELSCFRWWCIGYPTVCPLLFITPAVCESKPACFCVHINRIWTKQMHTCLWKNTQRHNVLFQFVSQSRPASLTKFKLKAF